MERRQSSLDSLEEYCHRDDHRYAGNRAPRSRRAIGKTGERNIGLQNIPQRSIKYVRDFVTTLIDQQWRFTFTMFILSYFITWTFFALIFYWIGYNHGDLNFDPETGKRLNKGIHPCIMRTTASFTGYFITSVDSQTTIGFGDKYPSEECPEAIAVWVIQIIVAIAIEGAMTSIVYAKMSRPPKKTRDYKFSKKAVICLREGQLCLVFRVDDPNRHHSIGTKVEAFLMGEKKTAEGEIYQQFQTSLELENNGQVSLLWPQTIAHIIDRKSPLYDVSAKDLLEKRFEIVLSITGSSRQTGQVTQARTSYLSKEIMWGHRFINIIKYDANKETYVADYQRFDTTETVTTALCSACLLEKVLEELKQSDQSAEEIQDYKETFISNLDIYKSDSAIIEEGN